MKKYFTVILIVTVIAIFSACASDAQVNDSDADFSGVDFSGKWCVSEIHFPGGKPLSSSELQLMEANFTLELLGGGVYFVYGADGAVLGQGQYSVSGSVLTCTAGEEQTEYQILDENTLRTVSEDKSATVMSRQPEPSPAITDEQPSDEDITGSDIDQETPEDADIPEDTDMPPEDTSDTAGVPTEEANQIS